MQKLFLDLQDCILGALGKKVALHEKALLAIYPIPAELSVRLHEGGELNDVIVAHFGKNKVLPGTVGMVHFDSPMTWGPRTGHSLSTTAMRLSHVVSPKGKKLPAPVRLNQSVFISSENLEVNAPTSINFMDFTVFPDGSIVLTPCENGLSVRYPAPRPVEPTALK